MANTPENRPNITPEQRGQILRFHLERYDQAQFGSQREIDGAAPEDAEKAVQEVKSKLNPPEPSEKK